MEANGNGLSEKISRRPSFKKAILATAPYSHANATAASKEHMERGQVKVDVYLEYVKAASRRGFLFCALGVVGQQVLSVMGSIMLRNWGEYNRNMKVNSLRHVLVYGAFSASSTLLGGVAAIVLLVWCTLRSARKLHDSVSDGLLRFSLMPICSDALLCDASPTQFLRGDTHRTVCYTLLSFLIEF
jgi:ATP-binding cassette, subfamily C (CFTR/MRP), member 1